MKHHIIDIETVNSKQKKQGNKLVQFNPYPLPGHPQIQHISVARISTHQTKNKTHPTLTHAHLITT